MRVVVAYDISSDRQRTKVAQILQGVLVRVQYSVFEGDVPRPLLAQTVRRALPFLDAETDSLRVYHLCRTCAPKVDVYGRKVDLENDPVRVL